ncbi:MAG: peptidoglycan-binding protein, partial [Christensenellales bacterium]
MKLKRCFISICCMVILAVIIMGGILINSKEVYAYDTHMVEIQTRLKELGYYTGDINGNYDDATVVAIKNFQ